MDRENLKINMYRVISEIAGEEIKDCIDLIQDLNFDSIQIIMLFTGLEDIYEVEFDFEDLDFEKYTNFDYLLEYFERFIIKE